MSLLIIGASTRAAAFSALRAGLQPWCADLFADLDLQARCPVVRLNHNYPHSYQEIIASEVRAPWMYTGGLENWPNLIAAWQDLRSLWGVRSESLAWARDPVRLASLLHDTGLPTPETRQEPPCDEARRWLIKKRRGAGGQWVREWFPDDDAATIAGMYWQEFIDGQPAAAIYVARDGETRLLGLTRQLVGVPWLHAAPFQYCGSIGPLSPPAALRRELVSIGETLAQRCNLTGLFGVDGVLAREHFWPVEINPRYTASVEVLEYATGLRALAWHRRAFDPTAPKPLRPPVTRGFVGKAILYALDDLTFPADGPWLSELRTPTPLDVVPAFADIPSPGEVIPRGRPILTFFVHKTNLISCEDALQTVAQDLTHRLFPKASLTAATPVQAADARIVSSGDSPNQSSPDKRSPR